VPEGLDPFDQPDALGRYAHFHARDLATFRVFERLHLAREVNPIRVSHHSVDHAGRTYLHWAAKENRTQVVAHTVVSRCQLPDSDGSNVDKFFQDVLNLIRTSGRFLALQVGDLRSFWALIVNRKDVMGRTALHWAAERQSLEALDELLKCGWLMPNQKDLQGNTALHLFLIALDPERPVHESKTKELF
jgi:ankyrin repeat protein